VVKSHHSRRLRVYRTRLAHHALAPKEERVTKEERVLKDVEASQQWRTRKYDAFSSIRFVCEMGPGVTRTSNLVACP
jgi:hypothetical protein